MMKAHDFITWWKLLNVQSSLLTSWSLFSERQICVHHTWILWPETWKLLCDVWNIRFGKIYNKHKSGVDEILRRKYFDTDLLSFVHSVPDIVQGWLFSHFLIKSMLWPLIRTVLPRQFWGEVTTCFFRKLTSELFSNLILAGAHVHQNINRVISFELHPNIWIGAGKKGILRISAWSKGVAFKGHNDLDKMIQVS